MINEALYEGLMKLGLAETKAKEAARQDQLIAELKTEINRQTTLLYEMHRIEAENNGRLNQMEQNYKVMDNRLINVENDVAVLKKDVSILKEDNKSIHGKLDLMTNMFQKAFNLDE